MGKPTSKLKQKEAEKNMQETQASKFTTSKKANVYFCLPEFSATKIVSWKFHVGDSTAGRYNMILGRYLLTALGLDLKFSKNIFIDGEGPYEGCLGPMIDVLNLHVPILDEKLCNEPGTEFVCSSYYIFNFLVL